MSEEETIHDMRDPNVGGEGVVLIVRQHNKYGSAHAGEKVRVDKAELSNRSTMEACITLADYEAHLAAKAAKKIEKPKAPPVKAIVDEALERMRQQAVERERKKAELEANAPPAAPATMTPAMEARAAEKAKKQKQK